MVRRGDLMRKMGMAVERAMEIEDLRHWKGRGGRRCRCILLVMAGVEGSESGVFVIPSSALELSMNSVRM